MRKAGLDFEELMDYDRIKKETNYAGYAEYFIAEYVSGDANADCDAAAFYQRLVDIDAVCGTDASLQLFRCINRTTRCDIIKV